MLSAVRREDHKRIIITVKKNSEKVQMRKN